MSTFDPDSFMNSTTSDANSTAYTPVPEGDHPGHIGEVKPGVTQNGKAYLGVKWVVNSEAARQATGMAEPSVRQTIWLDITESGALDNGKGRNVQLGKLRDALGQNTPGKPWMPGMLVGGAAMIKVKHSIDKRDNVTVQADVAAVTKLG
jgi:hypothetical protein